MSSTSPLRVTAQDFYDYEKCPHRVYLNRFGNPVEKLPHSDFLNLLFERALLHEADVMEDLPYEMPGGETLEEQASATLELMKAGVERIYQGVLVLPEDSGRPDLLEKVPGKSGFGDFLYKPVDIKSGSGYENEKTGKLRADYGTQLFHYAKLLEQIQGTFPKEGEIINKRGQRVVYPLQDFARLYAGVLPDIRALVNGKRADEPVRCGACPECQWWGHCEQILIAANDVSILPDVGRTRRVSLKVAGVGSIPDVLTFDFGATKIKGIGDKTAESLKRAAKAITSARMEVLAKPVLPDPPLKVYLDFEDDPTQELIYLCGMWVEPVVRGLNYHGFFAEDEGKEARLWADFQAFCAEIQRQDYVVFHYSSYEKTKLTQLERKYGAREKDTLEKFRSRMVDLRSIVEGSVVLPERSYGLKKVAPYAGHKYTDEKVGGAQSIVWFQEYQRNPANSKIVTTLLTYNQEDCLAMKAICDWLKSL